MDPGPEAQNRSLLSKFLKTGTLIGIIVLEVAAGIRTYRMLKPGGGSVRGDATASFIADVRKLPLQKESDVLRFFYAMGKDVNATDTASFLNGRVVQYMIQDGGINRTAPVSQKKPTGTFRFLAAGDSFTFGLYVNTQESYPSRLEQLLASPSACPDGRKFEVINTGVPGYDIQFTIRHIQTAGLSYAPDAILWVIKEDDFNSINQILLSEYNRLITDHPEMSEKDAHQKAYKEFEKEYPIYSVLFRQEQYLESFVAGLKIPIVFILPKDTPRAMLAIITRLHERHPNVYVYAGWKHTPDVQFPDGHPTAAGYERLAGSVADYLKSTGLLCTGM